MEISKKNESRNVNVNLLMAHAAKTKNHARVEFWLSRNADPDAEIYGEPALIWALHNRDIKTVEILLAYNANPEIADGLDKRKNALDIAKEYFPDAVPTLQRAIEQRHNALKNGKRPDCAITTDYPAARRDLISRHLDYQSTFVDV